MVQKDPTFPEIKKELVERVERIEEYMAQGIEQRKELTAWMQKVHIKVYGDDDSNPPKLGLDGRVKSLEGSEEKRSIIGKGFLKIAVGSLTTAIGGAVIWSFLALKEAFTKGH